MEDQDRRNHLYAVVDNLVEQQAIWVDSDEQRLLAGMPLYNAVEECMAVFKVGGLPESCRKLSQIVTDKLTVAWSRFTTNLDLVGDQTLAVLPDNSFWKAIDYLTAERRENTRPPPPALEPLKELRQQKVTDNQICKMYGFIDVDGRPELHKITEEIETPGKHTGPNSGWVDPREKAQNAAVAAADDAVAKLAQRRKSKVDSLTKPAPEGFAKLYKEGLSARQLAKNMHLTVAQVYAECERLELNEPPLDYDPAANARAPHEQQISPLDDASVAPIGRSERAGDDPQQSSAVPDPVDLGDAVDSDADIDPDANLKREVEALVEAGITEFKAVKETIGDSTIDGRKISNYLKTALKPKAEAGAPA